MSAQPARKKTAINGPNRKNLVIIQLYLIVGSIYVKTPYLFAVHHSPFSGVRGSGFEVRGSESITTALAINVTPN
jgi:hypothetical protein